VCVAGGVEREENKVSWFQKHRVWLVNTMREEQAENFRLCHQVTDWVVDLLVVGCDRMEGKAFCAPQSQTNLKKIRHLGFQLKFCM
jgi:hypothetical protein